MASSNKIQKQLAQTVINGKLWIQQDNTEGIALELERYGIPKKHIVLGFHPPDIRPYTGYAVE